MFVKTLTKPPFLKLTPGTYFVVRVDGQMELLPIPRQKDPSKVYPVSLFHAGPLPLPDPHDLLGYVMRTPSKALVAANFSLAEAFDAPGGVGAYYLLTYNGQKSGGGKKFNMWDVALLQFDEAERNTIEGKELSV